MGKRAVQLSFFDEILATADAGPGENAAIAEPAVEERHSPVEQPSPSTPIEGSLGSVTENDQGEDQQPASPASDASDASELPAAPEDIQGDIIRAAVTTRGVTVEPLSDEGSQDEATNQDGAGPATSVLEVEAQPQADYGQASADLPSGALKDAGEAPGEAEPPDEQTVSEPAEPGSSIADSPIGGAATSIDNGGQYRPDISPEYVLRDSAIPSWWPTRLKGKAREVANEDAVDLAKAIHEYRLHQFLTPEARSTIASYSGAGGIGDSLNEYYTPIELAKAAWGVLKKLGAPTGRVLEPSSGIGAFVATAPKGCDIVSVEINSDSNLIQDALFSRNTFKWQHAKTKAQIAEIRAAADEYAETVNDPEDVRVNRAAARKSAFLSGALGVNNTTYDYTSHSAGKAWAKSTGYSFGDAETIARHAGCSAAYAEMASSVLKKSEGGRSVYELIDDLYTLYDDATAVKRQAIGLPKLAPAEAKGFSTNFNSVNTVFEEFVVRGSARGFDIVIGNPPFGVRGRTVQIDGRRIARAEEYFLHRGVGALNEGGYLAMIVPSGFMQTSRARMMRRTLARDAQFVQGFRLPSSTFGDAGTGVSSDLIVLRKRDRDTAKAWAALDEVERSVVDPDTASFVDGSYFDRHPDAVLGEVGPGWRERAGMGHDFEVKGALQDAVGRIEEWAPSGHHNKLTVGDFYARLSAAGRQVDIYDRISETKNSVREQNFLDELLIPKPEEAGPSVADAILTGDRIIESLKRGDTEEARAQVDIFVSTYGNPHKDADIRSWMRASAAAAKLDEIRANRRSILSLLAGIREDGSVSDRLNDFSPQQRPAGTVEEALFVASIAGGVVNPTVIKGYLANSEAADEEKIRAAIKASGEFEPIGTDAWLSRIEFYRGDLWEQYDAVQERLEAGGPDWLLAEYRRQSKALLEKIDPVVLDDVEIAINSPFVPIDAITAYIKASGSSREIGSNKVVLERGLYRITNNAYLGRDLILRYLNRRGVKAEEEDDVAALNVLFGEWLLTSEYREEAERNYNRMFRGQSSGVEFSGSSLALPGITTERTPRDFQNQIARWLIHEKQALAAADVGLGKTTMAILAARALLVGGYVTNPFFVVPKSVAAKWVKEQELWFPGSKILLVGETQKTKKDGTVTSKSDSRDVIMKKLMSVTQNFYDAVILTEEAWNTLDVAPEEKWPLIMEDFMVQRMESLGNSGDKAIKKAKEQYEQRMARKDFDRRVDELFIGDLGIEALSIDEAHHYKNRVAPKNRFGSTPKFLGASGESIRAFDTYIKLKAARAANPGLYCFGFTATPAPNSPLEIYSMLSLFAPHRLERAGILSGEAFLDRFVEFDRRPTLSLDGTISEDLVTVGFKNLGELRMLMRGVIERFTAEGVGLKIPDVEPHRVMVDLTDEQRAYFAEIRRRLDSSSKEDEIHVFSALAKMAAAGIDLSLVEPGRAGAKSPKIEAIVQEVVSHFGPTDGSHIVFCEHIEVHQKIKAALVAAGIPEDQIVILNAETAPTSADRLKISDRYNAGIVRVAIGNTSVAGEGVDLQGDTGHIHHLDFPWGPDIFHQRNGRGVRQGNDREGVNVHMYFGIGSNDAYRFETMMAKQGWKDILWGDGDRSTNPAFVDMPSREQMMIMLAEDPEAARVAYEKNKAKRADELKQVDYNNFNKQSLFLQTLTASLKSSLLDNPDGNHSRLTAKIENTKAKMSAYEWLTFDQREAVLAGKPCGIYIPTGTFVSPDLLYSKGSAPDQILHSLTRDSKGRPAFEFRKFGNLAGQYGDVVPMDWSPKRFGEKPPLNGDTAPLPMDEQEVFEKRVETAAREGAGLGIRSLADLLVTSEDFLRTNQEMVTVAISKQGEYSSILTCVAVAGENIVVTPPMLKQIMEHPWEASNFERPMVVLPFPENADLYAEGYVKLFDHIQAEGRSYSSETRYSIPLVAGGIVVDGSLGDYFVSTLKKDLSSLFGAKRQAAVIAEIDNRLMARIGQATDLKDAIQGAATIALLRHDTVNHNHWPDDVIDRFAATCGRLGVLDTSLAALREENPGGVMGLLPDYDPYNRNGRDATTLRANLIRLCSQRSISRRIAMMTGVVATNEGDAALPHPNDHTGGMPEVAAPGGEQGEATGPLENIAEGRQAIDTQAADEGGNPPRTVVFDSLEDAASVFRKTLRLTRPSATVFMPDGNIVMSEGGLCGAIKAVLPDIEEHLEADVVASIRAWPETFPPDHSLAPADGLTVLRALSPAGAIGVSTQCQDGSPSVQIFADLPGVTSSARKAFAAVSNQAFRAVENVSIRVNGHLNDVSPEVLTQMLTFHQRQANRPAQSYIELTGP